MYHVWAWKYAQLPKLMAKIRLIISTEEADKVQASLADHCARRFHYGGGKAFCERTVNGTGPLTLTYYEYY